MHRQCAYIFDVRSIYTAQSSANRAQVPQYWFIYVYVCVFGKDLQEPNRLNAKVYALNC